MIALSKNNELIEEYNSWLLNVESDLRLYFNKDKKSWINPLNRNIIQNYLFPTSHYKCVYCERKPNDGGGFLEIDHVVPKSIDFSRVFSIDNLVPACKNCNTAKNNKSVNLNPYVETQFVTHLVLNTSTMVISGLSELGKEAINALSLSINTEDYRLKKKNYSGAKPVRLDVKLAIDKKLDILNEHKKNQTIDCLFDQLSELIALIDVTKNLTSIYATYLLNNNIFNELLLYVKSIDFPKYTKLCEIRKTKEVYCLSFV